MVCDKFSEYSASLHSTNTASARPNVDIYIYILHNVYEHPCKIHHNSLITDIVCYTHETEIL